LKSVGIGFTITQLKYHPSNDGFLAVFGNKQCLVVSLDLGSGSSSGEKNFSNIKVLQTIKLDLMLEQIAQDLCIVDCCWLPHSLTHLAVLTKTFLKIYDLSKDTMSPSVFFNEIQDASGINNMTAITIAKDQIVTNSQRYFIGLTV
jgi:E3 ubiquitin-protein ligase UBR4